MKGSLISKKVSNHRLGVTFLVCSGEVPVKEKTGQLLSLEVFLNWKLKVISFGRIQLGIKLSLHET